MKSVLGRIYYSQALRFLVLSLRFSLFRASVYRFKYLSRKIKGFSYFVPSFAIQRPACIRILNGKFYEPATHELIKNIFSEHSGSLVHAGTFFGDMLPSFSNSVGSSGTVYAFEPVIESYLLAKKCIEVNDLGNVLLFNSAISNEFGSARILTSSNGIHRGGSSEIRVNGNEYISKIPFDALNVNDLICLQLDVEGHELSALEGAKETIMLCKPVILVEDSNSQCYDFLKGIDYQYVGIIPGLKIWIHSQEKRFDARLWSQLEGFNPS